MSRFAANLQTESNDPIRREPPSGDEPDWKAELNAKLAAHRRRGADGRPADAPMKAQARGGSGASRVAARVAERYAAAPSYSEMLAASAAAAEAAQAAVHAAVQAAEEASAAAREVNAAAQVLLSNMQARESEEDEAREERVSCGLDEERAERYGDERWGAIEYATVEHPEPLPPRAELPERPAARPSTGIVDAFAEAVVPAAKHLPTKLIEFPRELVAVKKARPRIAEGPLVEEMAGAPSLRIFEVTDVPAREAEVSMNGAAGEKQSDRVRAASSPYGRRGGSSLAAEDEERHGSGSYGGSGWQAIQLGEHPVSEPGREPSRGQVRMDAATLRGRAVEPILPLYVATIGDRARAALVDIGIVGAAFALFALVFSECTTHLQADRLMIVGAAGVLLGMFVLYGWLFLSYGGSTPGMRYVRIAVCTFEDENPTRRVLRSRVAASLLAVLPLGLGVLWALFDEDGLGWHDRLTRSYQRSYR